MWLTQLKTMVALLAVTVLAPQALADEPPKKLPETDRALDIVPRAAKLDLTPANRHGWPPMAPELYRTWINYWNPGPGK
jgi:hypothetical protein